MQNTGYEGGRFQFCQETPFYVLFPTKGKWAALGGSEHLVPVGVSRWIRGDHLVPVVWEGFEQ